MIFLIISNLRYVGHLDLIAYSKSFIYEGINIKLFHTWQHPVEWTTSTEEYIWYYILPLYNNVTSVCIFIGCWLWSIKGHTHRWRQIHAISRQRTCFSFFMPPKSFKKPFEFLLYKTIFPCVCTVIDHRRRHSV